METGDRFIWSSRYDWRRASGQWHSTVAVHAIAGCLCSRRASRALSDLWGEGEPRYEHAVVKTACLSENREILPLFCVLGLGSWCGVGVLQAVLACACAWGGRGLPYLGCFHLILALHLGDVVLERLNVLLLPGPRVPRELARLLFLRLLVIVFGASALHLG